MVQFMLLHAEMEPVMKILNSTEAIRQLQQSRDSKQLLDFLVKGYDPKPSMVDTCYNFAKFRFDCGNFSQVFSLSILIMKRSATLSTHKISSSERMSRKQSGI